MPKLARVIAFLSACLATTAAAAGSLPDDPFRSVMWEDVAAQFFGGGDIVFDPRVKVMAPASAENQFSVPVTVDATGIPDAREIVIVADLNPFPHVLTFRPTRASPFIGVRIRLEQASAIHVGVRTADGSWRMGGTVVDAAGGGCSAPARAQGAADWMKRLGETRALLAAGSGNPVRMTIRIRHPMDTGLVDGIPVFHLKDIDVTTDGDAAVASLTLHEPVSENPTLTLLPRIAKTDRQLRITAVDTDGNRFGFALDVPPAAGN